MSTSEIWLADLPNREGHEQNGKRPVIVIAKSKYLVTVIPFTTNDKALLLSYTLDVVPTRENGLTEISIALVFQITSIDKSKLIEKLGMLEEEKTHEIKTMTKEYLKL